jgi:hypothetical protein
VQCDFPRHQFQFILDEELVCCHTKQQSYVFLASAGGTAAAVLLTIRSAAHSPSYVALCNARQLPQVVSLLQRCSLCYLSTFTNDHPHLSLMNFTYYQQDEVRIKHTRAHVVSYH